MRSIALNTRLQVLAVSFAIAFVAAFAFAQSVAAATAATATGAATSKSVTLPKNNAPAGSIRVSGMKATVSFPVSNGCPAYTIRWGDGKRTVGKSAEVCTMIAGTKRVSHTYTTPGRYRIVFMYRGEQVSKTIVIKKGAAQAASFGLSNVKTITAKYVDPNEEMADEEYTLYTITLKSGKVVVVKTFASAPVEARNKAFRDAGYTGNIEALLKMVSEEVDSPVAPAGSFGLADVASVTSKQSDPIPSAVDDEYTLYTITLKSGKVVEVKNHGNATVAMNDQAFRDAGYTGDIAALKQMVVVAPSPESAGAVQGVTTTDIRAALNDVLTQAQKLQAAVAALGQ